MKTLIRNGVSVSGRIDVPQLSREESLQSLIINSRRCCDTALLGRRNVRSRSHRWARRPSRWNDPRAWVQDRATFTEQQRPRSSDDSRAAARSSSPGGSSSRRKDTIPRLSSVFSFIPFLRFVVEILALYISLI